MRKHTLSPPWKLVLSIALVTMAGVVAGGAGLASAAPADDAASARPEILHGTGRILPQVNAVAWSPDGRILASGRADNTVTLWEVSSGRLLRVLSGSASVNSVAWSPDGRTLATGCEDNTVKLWDTSSGSRLRTLVGHSKRVASVAWGPDGRILASGSWDGFVMLWDPSSGKPLRTLAGDIPYPVSSVAWSPDGRTLASGDLDRSTKLWDPSSGELLRTLASSSYIDTVAWSPDGRTLASGSSDHSIRLWDPSSGKALLTLEGHDSLGGTALAWSPDGRTLAATGDSERSVKLWDPSSGEILRTLASPSSVDALAWSPDGHTLATGGGDATLLWREALDLERIMVADSENLWLAYHPTKLFYVCSPDGDELASVRFKSPTESIYPLKYYQAELRQSDLSHVSALEPPTLQPKPPRQAWERENKLSWLAVLTALLVCGVTLGLSQRRTPIGRLAVRILVVTAAGVAVTGAVWLQALSRAAPAPVKPEIFPQLGHSARASAVAWSRDGCILASSSLDGTVKLWEATSGKLLRTLAGQSSALLDMAWNPVDDTLATIDLDGIIKVWEPSSGTIRLRWQGMASGFRSLAWSPDGRTLATSGQETHTEVPADETLSSFFKNYTVMVWEASSGKLLRKQSDAALLRLGAWSPDSHTLAVISDGEAVKLWETSSDKLLNPLSGTFTHVQSVAWSPDGSTLAITADKAIQLWEPSSGKLLLTLPSRPQGYAHVDWSPDGRTLASASSDGTANLWNASSGDLLLTLRDRFPIQSVAWSPDGRTLASQSSDNINTVQLWDVSSGNSRLTLTLSNASAAVESLAWSHDGNALAAVSTDNTIKVWEVSSGRLRLVLSDESTAASARSSSLGDDKEYVLSVAWSPNGHLLATGHTDRTIKVWDASSGDLVRKLPGHSGPVQVVAWSPDGQTLASGSDDNTVMVWDSSSWKSQRKLSGHSGSVRAVAWSPDSHALASVSDDGTLKVWDLSTGSPRCNQRHPSSASWRPGSGLRYVAWSPDGRTLASGSNQSEGETLQLWDAASCTPRQPLSGYHYVGSAAWRPKGQLLALGSLDNAVRLLDVSSGNPLPPLEGHEASVQTVAWSPDGRTLASASSDGAILLWRESGAPERVLDLERVMVTQPGNVWLSYGPKKLFYVSSPEGEQLAAVRFDSRTVPVYPLAYYQAQLRRDDLSHAASLAPPAIEPKPLRQAWERIENKPLWFGALTTLYMMGLTALVLVQRRNPMRVAQRFFTSAGFSHLEQLSPHLLSLSSSQDGRRAYALLWQDDWQPLARQLPRRQEPSAAAPRVYVLYTDRLPESAQLQAFRAQLEADIVPLPAYLLAIALSEGTSRSVLQEAEDRFVTRIDPYDEARPVDDPAWFHGRTALLDRLPMDLQQGQHVGLFGLRKAGKTSLIKQLRNRGLGTPVVEIDCQSLEPVAIDYLQTILEKAHAELRRLKVRGLPPLRKLQSVGEFRGRFLALYARWTHAGRGGPLFLFLDEIDKLFVDRRRSNSDEVLGEYVRLFQQLRALAQEHRCLAVLVAAYRPEVNRQNGLGPAVGENPMFMAFQEYFLGALSAAEAQTMIREIGLWRAIHWEPEALAALHAHCGGHPFLTRLLASEACDQGDTHRVDAEKVEQAARSIETHFRKHRIGRYYQESIWDVLQEDERKALLFLAEPAEGIEKAALPPELEDALTQLEHFGLVQQENERLRLSSRLFQRWVAKEGRHE